MKNSVYNMVKSFKDKYPMTICWRLKAHSKVIEKHLNSDEEIEYVFAAQKNANPLDIITTYIVVITDKRILLGQKRLLFGYMFTSITPDMFNDLKVQTGLVWGKVFIDTVKEFIALSNIDKSALSEIETNVTTYVMEEKKKYALQNQKIEKI
ncbi:MAG: hypothetical protein HFI87_01700 [Bacilli bacterium]|nr:hypothetical protein [Bacilli bacterium]